MQTRFFKRGLILLIILNLITSICFSQETISNEKDKADGAKLNNILLQGIPGHSSKEKTVNQGNLKQFVNMQTGALTYNVPFFKVASYRLSVPVGLNYYSDGIKVNQESFPVGLGWSLNAGGSIQRIKKGLPDDGENGFLNTGDQVLDYLNLSDGEKKSYINEILGNKVEKVTNDCFKRMYEVKDVDKIDAEPDIFQFTFPGGAGFFTFDNNGEIIFYPHRNYSIDYTLDQDGHLIEFEIITKDGVRYYFGGTQNAVEDIKQSSISVPLINDEEYSGLPLYHEITEEEYNNSDDWPNFNVEYNGKYYAPFDEEKSDPEDYSDLGCRYAEWYSKSNPPRIDKNGIKETTEEAYNIKWHLTKIVHPSGDEIKLSYEKEEWTATPQRPVVTSVNFENLSNINYNGREYAYDPECSYNGNDILVFPGRVVYDYEYFNPDFSKITLTTGQEVTTVEPPKYTEKPRYGASSLNYNLALVEKRKVYITEISTSSGNKVLFDYKVDDKNWILKNVELYHSNNKIKDYLLRTTEIESDHSFSEYSDPFNLIEALVSKGISFSNEDYKYVNNLSQYDLDFDNFLLEKYLKPGYQGNVYKRLFLKNIYLNTDGPSRKLYSFEYNNPQRLPRSNSLVRNIRGYPISEEDYNSLRDYWKIKSADDQSISTIYPFSILNMEGDPSIGILDKVKTEAGAEVSFNFLNTPFHLSSVDYSSKELSDPISIGIKFISRPYNEGTKSFGSESNSEYTTMNANRSYSSIFKFEDWDDEDVTYNLRQINFNTEYVNDVNWFNNGISTFSECWIDYNGNGYEVYKFVTPDDVGHGDYDNFVDLVEPQTFYNEYDPSTNTFNSIENISQVDDYNNYPFANIKSLHYAIGMVKEYFVLNENEDVLKRTINTYNFSSNLHSLQLSYGIKAGRLNTGYWKGNCYNGLFVNYLPAWKQRDPDYRAGRYAHKSIYYYLESTQTFEYDPESSTELMSETVNEIGANHLMKRQQSKTAKNSTHTIHTLTLYPEDFTTNTGFIGALKTMNIKNTPIEVVNYQVNDEGEQEILSGEIYEYDPDEPTQLDKHYHLELSKPLPLSSFKFSNASIGIIPATDHKGTYDKYSGYELTKQERKYDDFGRVFASKNIEGVWKGTLFHKTFNKPVASVVNQEIQRKDASDNESESKSVPGSEIEDYLSIGININKKQTINITASMVKTSGSDTDDFQYYIYIVGPADQINQAFNSSDIDYNVELEPGKYEIQFYSRDISTNNNQYRKDMEVSFVNEVYDAYFTSFEEDGTPSENARSGGNYMESGTIEIPYAVDNPSEYVISYWYYENNQWKYSGKLHFQQSISVSNPVDDLRMHKKGARMSSMVYDEEGKLICEIDENENKSCYEYDDFDRLIIEKDHKDNIVRRLEYNLVGTN